MSRGIDYADPRSQVNRDPETGIRYGIISLHSLNEYAFESFEPEYDAACPACGEDWPEDTQPHRTEDGYGANCPACDAFVRDGEEYADEPSRNVCDDGEYQALLDDSSEVWVFKSPYFTRAAFCSPCAPGACYLASPCDDGERCYALGHEWFDGTAPYPVYSVATGLLVEASTK